MFGIFATGFSQKPQNTSRILVQSTDGRISEQTLNQSVAIISNRLKNFGSGTFEVSKGPGKNQIQIVLGETWDLKFAEKLVTQKGEIGFYETYYYKSVNEILKGNTTLFSLLHTKLPGDSTATIVCTTEAGKKVADQYLNSAKKGAGCKFVWNNLFENPDICLYALKTEKGSGVIMKGTDIESFQFGNDSVWHLNYINFNCKQPAIRLWSDITKRNINKAIAIVMDNNVIYAPVVRCEIPGGKNTITGDFTPAQLKFIAAVGNSGELPVSLKVVK